MEVGVFRGCDNLTSISCKAITPPAIHNYTFSEKNKMISLYVPEASVSIYKETAYWNEFVNLIGMQFEILGKCETPIIGYANGKVSLNCITEGVEVISWVSSEQTHEYQGLNYDLVPVYTITAYATKNMYENSDTVSLTICWIECTEEHVDDGALEEPSEPNVSITIPSQPVLIQSSEGAITITGLADGTVVTATSTAGTQLATATTTDGTATLTTDLEAGSIAIVKIGEHSVKVVIK